MPIASLKFMGRWTSEATLAHYIQFATAQQVLLRLSYRTSRNLRLLLLQGFFLLEPSAEVKRTLHRYQHVDFLFPEPTSLGDIARCLHEYGQLEATVSHGSHQGRSFGRRALFGRHR